MYKRIEKPADAGKFAPSAVAPLSSDLSLHKHDSAAGLPGGGTASWGHITISYSSGKQTKRSPAQVLGVLRLLRTTLLAGHEP